jgi:hypothetical protein
MRSKAWLAASVWLRLAHLPSPASRMQRSRHLHDTLAAAPGLLAHACVTDTVKFGPTGPKLRRIAVCVIGELLYYAQIFAIAAFTFVQSTQELASMTTYGLMYEGPVIFATVREAVSSFEEELQLLSRVNRRWLSLNWLFTFIAYAACRVPATVTFVVYALWHYDAMVAEVSFPARVSFWVFGFVFSGISAYWLVLLCLFYADDRRKLSAIDATQRQSALDCASPRV